MNYRYGYDRNASPFCVFNLYFIILSAPLMYNFIKPPDLTILVILLRVESNSNCFNKVTYCFLFVYLLYTSIVEADAPKN